MGKFNWECPFCGKNALIDEELLVDSITTSIGKYSKYNTLYFHYKIITCPNVQCQEVDISCWTTQYDWNNHRKVVRKWNLQDDSIIKTMPSYIPQVLIDDYEEACLIKDLSPKASATLSRRCLQGMIRDFWGINKATLSQEIKALEDKLDAESWAAIDALRNIGNIGAHMERDVNHIIEVDPEEAYDLISLLEILFEDWYVARHEKQEKLKRIVEISDRKKNAKNGVTADIDLDKTN